MSTRSKSGATKLRRRRDIGSTRVEPEGKQPDSPAEECPQTTRRRRREPAPQDVALYSCQCGFVFEAPVSTSVGCPHCGDSQAW